MFVTAVGILALYVVSGCQGNTFKMGACPRVTVMDQMDFDRFIGEWYVIQRFNPMATCTKIILEKGSDGSYSVNETSRPLGFNFGINPYMKSRKIQFLRNDTTSIFRIERSFAHFTLSTFGVIETDYDNHALVWGCDPVLFGSVQNVDILSRKPTLDPETLMSAREILKDMGIEHRQLDNVSQVQCAESEEGDQGSSSQGGNTNNMVTAGRQ